MGLSGEEYGLNLILDSVPATPDANFQLGTEMVRQDERLKQSSKVGEPTNADVYISTLERFEVKGSGTFALHVIKQMTGQAVETCERASEPRFLTKCASQMRILKLWDKYVC